MANDAALRSAIVWLAVIIVLVGIFTFSLKKMVITYAFGMVGIAGILLPDWDFFDRDFSRWCYPVTAEERAALLARRSGFKRNIFPKIDWKAFPDATRIMGYVVLPEEAPEPSVVESELELKQVPPRPLTASS